MLKNTQKLTILLRFPVYNNIIIKYIIVLYTGNLTKNPRFCVKNTSFFIKKRYFLNGFLNTFRHENVLKKCSKILKNVLILNKKMSLF